MDSPDILMILLLVSPLILIQLGVVIYALLDLSRRAAVRGNRVVWAVALVLTGFGFPTGILVAGLYLAWGRNVEA
jgi:hypothetical protein